jgi:hypothetical protein
VSSEGSNGAIEVTGAPSALDLERVTASAGGTVAVRATLNTRERDLSAVAADIIYDSTLVQVAVNGESNPDCVVDDAIGAGSVPDKELVVRVLNPDQTDNEILRVGVIARDNNEPLTDGITFSCNFRVADDAGAVSVLLGNSPDGSTRAGDPVGMIGEDGAITVD